MLDVSMHFHICCSAAGAAARMDEITFYSKSRSLNFIRRIDVFLDKCTQHLEHMRAYPMWMSWRVLSMIVGIM